MSNLNQAEASFPLFIFESRLAATSRKLPPSADSRTTPFSEPWFGNPPLPTTEKGRRFDVLFLWWEGVDSNHRRHGRQIYSLLPLAAREPSLVGAGDRNRTSNLLITNQLLCQLSYTSPIAIFRFGASGRNRTTDTGIFSPLLYRLSYRGIFFMSDIATTHKIFWRFGRDSNPRPLA